MLLGCWCSGSGSLSFTKLSYPVRSNKQVMMWVGRTCYQRRERTVVPTQIAACFVATEAFSPVSCLAGSLLGSEELRDLQIIKVL